MSLLVRFADDEHEVRTVTALDELLDRVALDRQPLLVELVGDAASAVTRQDGAEGDDGGS